MWEHPGVSVPNSEGSWSQRLPLLVRIVSHFTVWASVLVATVVELSKGWIAAGDDAAIAIRSYQSLSSHPPWVGVYSTAGGLGHSLYDPGPLMFWLLAIPVHIDPSHGAHWGAALLWGAALSLAVEALWTTRLWLGCAVIAFVVVDLLWLTPSIFENLVWNAYFPVPFLVATIALAWVVGTGSFGWWPPLVFVASVASQSHLTFVIPCVLLTLLAPVIGVVVSGGPVRLRWFPVGLGVALVCWLAPLLQNTGSNGNLSALLHSNSGQKVMGLTFALQVVAATAAPFPIWLTQEPLAFFPVAVFIGKNSAIYGFSILVIVAIIAAVAYRTGRRALCALSTVCMISLVAVTMTFAIFPGKNAISIDYLIVCLWVVGTMLWSVVIWSAAAAVAAIVRRQRELWSPGFDTATPLGAALATGHLRELQRSMGWSTLLAILVIAPIVVVGLAGGRNMVGFEPTDFNSGWTPFQAATVGRVATQIERTVPRGPLVYTIKWHPTGSLIDLWIAESVAWRLEADGWQPGLYSYGGRFTGLTPTRNSAYVVVKVHGNSVSAVRAPCRSPISGCPGR